MLPLTFAMSTAMRNFAQTSNYLIPGQHYLETFMLLSCSNQDHTFMGDYIISILNQQTQLLLCLWQCIFHSDIQHGLEYGDAYSAQTFSIALTVVTHIPLRHLVAIIPSQTNDYFLPSFQRDLQHKCTLYSGCH